MDQIGSWRESTGLREKRGSRDDDDDTLAADGPGERRRKRIKEEKKGKKNGWMLPCSLADLRFIPLSPPTSKALAPGPSPALTPTPDLFSSRKVKRKKKIWLIAWKDLNSYFIAAVAAQLRSTYLTGQATIHPS